MNLHSLVSPIISAVNPMSNVLVRIATGTTIAADGTQIPTYATPGALTASISGGVLNVSAIAKGKLQPGQLLAGAGIGSAVRIAAQLSGKDGGLGAYSLSAPQDDVGSEAITTSLPVLGQIQPISWRDLQMLDGVSMNGVRNAIYLNGNVDGIVRVNLKGGDLITVAGQVWLVVQQLEGWNPTSGWTKAAIVLQDGA